MEAKCLMIALGLALIAFFNIEASADHKLVVYWGQNAVYNMKKEKQYWEKPLTHFCQQSSYDVVVLAFMHVFFDSRQKDSLPGLNFAFHCETSMNNELPFLLRCPQIEAGIKECQKNGKTVLMSLGGASGGYGFTSDAQAKTFAHTVWNLLLAGTKNKDIRPFGSAILDGVDLDIEGGSSVGYTAFVREIRGLMDAGTKKYIIAAAPQCPYPDHFVGPSPGTALGDVPEMVDELYIQFYNNYCHTGDAKQFNIKTWLNFSKKRNGPKIFVGMPSHERAAFGRGYWRTPAEVASIYNKYKNEPRFGGFMLWDASFDQNHIINGKPYSEHIVALFGNKGPRPTNLPQTIATDPTAKPGPTTQKPDTTASKGTGGITSCNGISDGIYKHAKYCGKFIECIGGTAHTKSCPPGLKFNPDQKYCDWPANVTC